MKKNKKFLIRGFILINVLWVLSFLTVLAVALGMGVRQKIEVLKRIDIKVGLRLSAEAGVKKAMAILSEEIENGSFLLTASSKMKIYQNPVPFTQIKVRDFIVDIVSVRYSQQENQVVEFFGIEDEQSKLNINTIDPMTMEVLFRNILQCSHNESKALVNAVIEWRGDHRQELSGPLSEGYYRSLEYPYEIKKKSFERIDELLLVKGFTQEVFEKLRPFITIYGDGKININTTSRVVLEALGLDLIVIERILKLRDGVDGLFGTADDYIFIKPFDIGIDMKTLTGLEEKYIRQIDALNSRRLLGVNSVVLSFQSRATQRDRIKNMKKIDIVVDVSKNKILYWNEK